MLKVDKDHEREAFRRMSFREKAEHIAAYYWVPIVAGLFILFVVIWALNHYVFNPPPEKGLEFCVFASNMDDEACDMFKNRINARYEDRLGEKVFAVAQVQDYGDSPIFSEQIRASVSQIIAMVSAQELDCIISCRSNTEAMGMSAYFISLDEVFGEARMKELEAYLKETTGQEFVLVYTIIDDGKEELHPTAFSVKGIPAFDELFTTVYDPCVAFVANSERLDFAADVIYDMIMGQVK